MALEIISQRLNTLSCDKDAQELRTLLNSMYDALYAVATRLDADATVTDTSYRADVNANILKA
jgi:hypothetical protein